VAALFLKRFRVLFLLVASVFYLLSNNFVANFLLLPLELPYRDNFKTIQDADAVVVLGGGDIKGSVNLPLSGGAYKRAIYGLMIAKTEDLPLVFSGGGRDKRDSEAKSFLKSMTELQKYLLVDLKFSDKLHKKKFSILTEDRSLDTFQNAKYTKEIFEKAGVKKPLIYLVTSAYHMTRAIRLYGRFGFKIIPSATDFKVNNKQSDIWDYFPQMEAFYKSYLAIHEYAGLLSLKLRGI
jgi:uncharacterized SAM-binding protein YcdF (DUF218 family)